jgi:hypothetical protein
MKETTMKSSELFRPVPQTDQSGQNIVRSQRQPGDPLSKEALAQLEALKSLPDDQIDFSDIPPTPPEFWRRAAQRQILSRHSAPPPFLVKRELLLKQGSERELFGVEIGPLKSQADCFGCHVRIAGPDGETNRDIFGVDGVQAVQLALRFAGSELDRLGGDNWESLSGETGHGFDRLLDLQEAS